MGEHVPEVRDVIYFVIHKVSLLDFLNHTFALLKLDVFFTAKEVNWFALIPFTEEVVCVQLITIITLNPSIVSNGAWLLEPRNDTQRVNLIVEKCHQI